MEDNSGLFYRLQHLDTRVIHAVIFVLIVLPLIKPIGFPVQISQGTQMAFDTINAIPEGSIVLWSYEMAANTEPELMPCAIAWMHQLMKKKCKIITFAIYTEEGPLYAQRAFELLGPQYNYKYGEDMVVLPYRAGMETALAAIARDIRGVFPQDFYRKNIADLPLMQKIKGMSDFKILLKSSGWNPDLHVRQMVTVYNIPMVANCTGIVAPGAMAYLSSGQIKGLVGALAGAAEYEKLLGLPGTATRAMDAQSTTHALTVILVLVGNIGYFASRGQQRKEGKS